MVSGYAGAGDRPMPGGSNAMAWYPASWGSSGSQLCAPVNTPECSSSGSPCPLTWVWMVSPWTRTRRLIMVRYVPAAEP